MNKSMDKNEEIDEKVNKFAKDFHGHGLNCGLEICKLVKEMHPNALLIVPLYRSCIAIEQSEEDKEEGIANIHAYGDPHWIGGEISIEDLSKEDHHKKFLVKGDRQGPDVIRL